MARSLQPAPLPSSTPTAEPTAPAAATAEVVPPEPNPAPSCAQDRLAYISRAGLFVAHGDTSTQLDTFDAAYSATEITWSREGRYVAWLESQTPPAPQQPIWRVGLYDMSTKEAWRVQEQVGQPAYFGTSPLGFVVLLLPPRLNHQSQLYVIAPRDDAGNMSRQLTATSATLPWRARFTDMRSLASLDQGIVFSMESTHSSMYGGPDDIFFLNFTGQSKRVAEDQHEGEDSVWNLHASHGVVYQHGKRYAYISGATAGGNAGTWLFVRIRDTQSWNVVADVPLPERRGSTHSFESMTPGVDGRLWVSMNYRKQGKGSDEIFEVTDKAMKPTGLQGWWASSSLRGTMAILGRPSDGPDAPKRALMVQRPDGTLATLATDSTQAAWAPVEAGVSP